MKLQLVTPNTRFIINRADNIVYDTQNPAFIAELLAIHSSLIRDDCGVVTGHDCCIECETPNGERIVIDEELCLIA